MSHTNHTILAFNLTFCHVYTVLKRDPIYIYAALKCIDCQLGSRVKADLLPTSPWTKYNVDVQILVLESVDGASWGYRPPVSCVTVYSGRRKRKSGRPWNVPVVLTSWVKTETERLKCCNSAEIRRRDEKEAFIKMLHWLYLRCSDLSLRTPVREGHSTATAKTDMQYSKFHGTTLQTRFALGCLATGMQFIFQDKH